MLKEGHSKHKRDKKSWPDI